jgi:hypothetical protein
LPFCPIAAPDRAASSRPGAIPEKRRETGMDGFRSRVFDAPGRQWRARVRSILDTGSAMIRTRQPVSSGTSGYLQLEKQHCGR